MLPVSTPLYNRPHKCYVTPSHSRECDTYCKRYPGRRLYRIIPGPNCPVTFIIVTIKCQLGLLINTRAWCWSRKKQKMDFESQILYLCVSVSILMKFTFQGRTCRYLSSPERCWFDPRKWTNTPEKLTILYFFSAGISTF